MNSPLHRKIYELRNQTTKTVSERLHDKILQLRYEEAEQEIRDERLGEQLKEFIKE